MVWKNLRLYNLQILQTDKKMKKKNENKEKTKNTCAAWK